MALDTLSLPVLEPLTPGRLRDMTVLALSCLYAGRLLDFGHKTLSTELFHSVTYYNQRRSDWLLLPWESVLWHTIIFVSVHFLSDAVNGHHFLFGNGLREVELGSFICSWLTAKSTKKMLVLYNFWEFINNCLKWKKKYIFFSCSGVSVATCMAILQVGSGLQLRSASTGTKEEDYENDAATIVQKCVSPVLYAFLWYLVITWLWYWTNS